MTIIIGIMGLLLAFWILALKISVLRVLGYELWIDITISLAIFGVFIGSTDGAIIAMLGGALVSLTLAALKAAIGYERFSFRERRWIYHPPRWINLAKNVQNVLSKLD